MTDDTTPDAALSGRLRELVTDNNSRDALREAAERIVGSVVAARESRRYWMKRALDAESRAVAAEKRATEAEVLHAAMKSTAGKYASEAFAAEAEVARLQGIVEKAPHPTACRSHVWNGRGWDQVEAACNCWKRDAILAAPEKEGEQ